MLVKSILLWIGLLPALINDGGYQIGEEVADFKLKNLDGKWVSMSDYTDAKGYIIIFTCNHCPYAKLYEERIIALNNIYKPKGYPVIAINPNDTEVQPEDSFENMKVRAKEKGFTFPYLIDESQQVAKAFGATRTPDVFIVNKENKKMKLAYKGAIDDNHKNAAEAQKKYVEMAVNDLLQGKKAGTNNTKAIGCSIKWKKS